MVKYQKTINLLDNVPNQPSMFRIKSWFEVMMKHVKCIKPIVIQLLKLFGKVIQLYKKGIIFLHGNNHHIIHIRKTTSF